VKQIEILEKSYQVANDQDNERIRYLRMEGKPNNWDDIYLTYKSLNDRQSLVKSVTPLNKNGKTIDFSYVITWLKCCINARQLILLCHGIELMKSGIKESYDRHTTNLSGQKNMWATMKELTPGFRIQETLE